MQVPKLLLPPLWKHCCSTSTPIPIPDRRPRHCNRGASLCASRMGSTFAQAKPQLPRGGCCSWTVAPVESSPLPQGSEARGGRTRPAPAVSRSHLDRGSGRGVPARAPPTHAGDLAAECATGDARWRARGLEGLKMNCPVLKATPLGTLTGGLVLLSPHSPPPTML